jgi:hypothetical protein
MAKTERAHRQLFIEGVYNVFMGKRPIGRVTWEGRGVWAWSGCDAEGDFRFSGPEWTSTLREAVEALEDAYRNGELD